MNAELLDVQSLCKIFPSTRGDLTVLEGLDFRPRPRALTAIVGASGSGKSTLLHVLGTLERPTRGTLLYRGQDLSRLSPRELARFRNQSLGFVFQFHHLLPEFTALENVMMPGLMGGGRRYEVEARAVKLLSDVGLANRSHHRPGELSGGEQQRVAVARALLNHPLLLLADEPSGNLDRDNGRDLHDLLVGFVRDEGHTIVVATHDERLAGRADEVYLLEGGKLHPEPRTADKQGN